MRDSGRRRFVWSFIRAPAVLALSAASGEAQQSGHGTVPSSGPAAQGGFVTADREQDPVLARIEELRGELSDLAKQYKKTKAASQPERRADLLAALARARTEVASVRERIASR